MSKELNLQEIQEGAFRVLLELKGIFEKNGWSFYLAYGTLIGAIRHKGFIPWDDDIDVWVPRKDYEEFIEYYKKNKTEFNTFKLFHYKTCNNYPYVIARFSDTSYLINYDGIEDYGLGLFVDLYPLDEVCDADYKEFHKLEMNMILDLHKIILVSKSPLKKIAKKILKPFFLFKNGVISTNKLISKIDTSGQKYNGTSQKFMDVPCWTFGVKEHPFRKSYFEKVEYAEFNGYLLPVPYGYDSILREVYGDYMSLPPVEQQIAHHYYTVKKK